VGTISGAGQGKSAPTVRQMSVRTTPWTELQSKWTVHIFVQGLRSATCQRAWPSTERSVVTCSLNDALYVYSDIKVSLGQVTPTAAVSCMRARSSIEQYSQENNACPPAHRHRRKLLFT